jgi:hypothetical protein
MLLPSNILIPWYAVNIKFISIVLDTILLMIELMFVRTKCWTGKRMELTAVVKLLALQCWVTKFLLTQMRTNFCRFRNDKLRNSHADKVYCITKLG